MVVAVVTNVTYPPNEQKDKEKLHALEENYLHSCWGFHIHVYIIVYLR